jgi:hypothetical protein
MSNLVSLTLRVPTETRHTLRRCAADLDIGLEELLRLAVQDLADGFQAAAEEHHYRIQEATQFFHGRVLEARCVKWGHASRPILPNPHGYGRRPKLSDQQYVEWLATEQGRYSVYRYDAETDTAYSDDQGTPIVDDGTDPKLTAMLKRFRDEAAIERSLKKPTNV